MNITKKPAVLPLLPKGFPFYTIGEEIANSVLHGIGTLLAIAGLVLLNLKTRGFLGVPKIGNLGIVAVILFTATMIGMFLISTLYHAIQHQGAKRILRRFDHSVIFVFIAGTYTPLCLIGLGGAWGWSLVAVEWTLALLGIALNIMDFKGLKKFEIAAYIMMGWAIVVGCVPLVRSVPIESIIFLVVGGIAYTGGVLVYRRKDIRNTHAFWHAFVLIGTICHWFSVWSLI
jgi:hemolysin III